jgi:signal peptidase S26 family
MPGDGRTGYAFPPADRPGTTKEQDSATGWRPRPAARTALILALSLALVFGVVRPFGAEAFRVSSGSMAPTLRAGDHVLVGKLAYRIGEPRRGTSWRSGGSGMAS